MREALERWDGVGSGSAPLAWLRPDPRAPLMPVWRACVLLILTGGGLCAWFFGHIDEDPIIFLLLGLLCVATGMILMVRAALRSLGDERCVAFFREGVVLRDHQAARAQVAWAALARVEELDEGARLVIHQAQGAEEEGGGAVSVEMAFMPLSAAELGALLKECARRSGLGVPLKLDLQLERLGVKVGLPQAGD